MVSIKRPWLFYCGVFLTTLSTLVHQVVTTRIFSVITWYHLAFLAISLAMLGMTAAGLYVYFSGTPEDAEEAAEDAQKMLVRHACLLAVSLPASHVILLWISLAGEFQLEAAHVGALVGAVVITASPFFFSGVVVAVALTRSSMPLGRVYGVDLLGAALGCLAAVALLEWIDPSTACAVSGAFAATAALAFSWSRGSGLGVVPLGLALALAALSWLNGAMYPNLIYVSRMNGMDLPRDIQLDEWNSHSRVVAFPERMGAPFYWGHGSTQSPESRRSVRNVGIQIDGAAYTSATRFKGDPAELEWVRHDVTSLPYQLRGDGRVGVIGVGGGRDLLTSLGFGAEHVTGVEVNGILVDLLRGPLRSYAGLADHPDITLVHDDGRSWMTRTEERFDLIQMSLIDTFAATSAGAMTLTENGLYTMEAWGVFLDRLHPGGVFSVSRFYNPERVSETARALSLAVGTLITRGADDPAAHIVLATAGNVSTLIVGVNPLDDADVRQVRQTAAAEGFRLVAAPGVLADDILLRMILSVKSWPELEAATQHPVFQLEPSTDDRPFFFNMLKFGAWKNHALEDSNVGVVTGNLKATQTLLVLFVIVLGLIVVTIFGPLALRGSGHGLPLRTFVASASFFALIGLGFMLIEVGLMQKFSILLGHPIHSLAITLMSIILASGIGSLVSDRISVDGNRLVPILPAVAASIVGLVAIGVQSAIDVSISSPLPLRVATVIALTFPVAFFLGMFFPIGMRLLGATNPSAQSWMWGLNGALGVMGTLASIMIAMRFGIRVCLLAGALCYLLLTFPMLVLGAVSRQTPRQDAA